MHDTAHTIGGLFLYNYAKAPCTIVELGAMNVNGTLRDFCPETAIYIGLDVQKGPGVDVVVKSGAPLPLASDSADIVVSSSMLEHDIFFWETFLEMARIAKPQGVIYVNAPSNGKYHRYSTDNWRFYPDSGKALESWSKRNGYTLTLVESFVAEREKDVWNDFVAIFVKGTTAQDRTNVFLSDKVRCTNIWRVGQPKVLSEREASEDIVLIEQAKAQQQSRPPETAKTQGTLARLFRWRPTRRERSKDQVNLIPHIRVAFPNIAMRLADFGADSKGLTDDIRRLLDFYTAAWPFDESYYLQTYPDVAEAVHTDRFHSAWLHFRRAGYLEGRFPVRPVVDTDWYLKNNPDVAAAVRKDPSRSAEQHFINHGYREGRLPCKPRFDAN